MRVTVIAAAAPPPPLSLGVCPPKGCHRHVKGPGVFSYKVLGPLPQATHRGIKKLDLELAECRPLMVTQQTILSPGV